MWFLYQTFPSTTELIRQNEQMICSFCLLYMETNEDKHFIYGI
jgi:hypothetical protein